MSEAPDESRFRVDPDLLQVERETYLRFADDEDVLTIHTDNPDLARRLMAHPEFEETRRYSNGDTIHGVEGTLPIRYLTISSKGRQHDRHAAVVSSAVLGGGGE